MEINLKKINQAICIIIIFILPMIMISCGTDPVYNKDEFEVQCSQVDVKDDYLTIKLWNYKVNEKGEKKLDENGLVEAPTEINSGIDEYVEKIFYQNGRPLKIEDGNKIYLCPTESSLLLKFVIKTSDNLLDTQIVYNSNKGLVEFNHPEPNGKINPKANCGSTPLGMDEILVNDRLKNCSLSVVISRKYTDKTYYVSVTGRQGPYFPNQIFFSRKNLITRNIFVYMEGQNELDAVEGPNNGDPISPGDCEPCTAIKDIQLIENATKEYLNNPDNDSYRLKLTHLIQRFPQLICFMGSEKLEGFNTMNSRITSSKLIENINYDLVKVEIQKDCSSISFILK